MKKYLSLMRVNHYIKNLLIFLAILYNGKMLNIEYLKITIISFFSFCFIASAVYVFNDLIDVENDKNHPIKKKRPIASGAISIKKAILFFLFLIIISLSIQTLLFITNILTYDRFLLSIAFLLMYLLINIIYSKYAKNIPVVDIIVLALGFLIRVYYGGAIVGISISNWLYLTVLSFSLYLVIGKRRGELIHQKGKTREVLKYYTKDFLDKMMYVFLSCTLVFYSLWCCIGYNGTPPNDMMIYSVLIIIFIMMRYSLIVEGDSYADPVDVLLKDNVLIGSVLIYAIYMGVILYV